MSRFGADASASPSVNVIQPEAVFAEARELVAPLDVDVKDGSLVAQADKGELGDAVWRVAMAATQIAERAARFRQPRHPREQAFTLEVERVLRDERRLPVEREVKLEGSSGHIHRATLFVPTTHTILEPVEATAHYNAISAIYAKSATWRTRTDTGDFRSLTISAMI